MKLLKSNLQARLLTAVVGIPVVLLFVLTPYAQYLGISILILLTTIAGVQELHDNLLKQKTKVSWTGYLGMLLPVAKIIELRFFPGLNVLGFTLCAFLGLAFLVECIEGGKDNFENSLARMSATTLNIVYPGYLMAQLIRVAHFPNAPQMIIVFLSIIFGSDSLAYICGRAFGKNNKGFVKCSPNKSLAGFVGGTVLIGILGACATFIFTNALHCTAMEMFLIAFVTACFGTAGDLFESMLKRACGVKDSGFLIPGRGGLLDCIDSVSVAAPIFVLFAEIFLQ